MLCPAVCGTTCHSLGILMTSIYRIAIFGFLLCLPTFVYTQNASQRGRVTAPVDDSRRVTLRGNTHPLARAKYDAGVAPDATPARRMLISLSRTPEQDSELKQLLNDQQSEGSKNYRKWLTPEEFGVRFGPAAADLNAVVAWLNGHGFQIDRVSAAKNVIEFSGTVGQVKSAFGTEIHKYVVNGREHWANATDPQVPQALAPVLNGVVSLNNFSRKSMVQSRGVFTRNLQTGEMHPAYTISTTSGNYYGIAPGDFATIYNTKSLLQAGTNGTGQTIAIIGLSNISMSDVTNFRNLFALGPINNFGVIVDGDDPGILDGEEFESTIDVEWASAVAPAATVKLVIASDTSTTSGLDLAALHAINSNIAGVISLSYGICESSLGTAGNLFYQNLWAQAAAQGITVVVSAGDNGSAGCDNPFSQSVANKGLAVSGPASTPYNVAVGGTDFDYGGSAAPFWSSTNNPTTQTSALSYIPEAAWNSSCANAATAGNLNVCPILPSSGQPPESLNLLAGSGGASNCSSVSGGVCHGTAKPVWQSGTGVPNDGVRDIPDISMFAAINSSSNTFYLGCDARASGSFSCQADGVYSTFLGVGGTSLSAPSFAAIVALAEQKSGKRLGNVNYLLYSLAAKTGSSCTSSTSQAASCIFNDVIKGNISVPCTAGAKNCSVTSGTSTGVVVDGSNRPAYASTAGYDLATGLGSVNAGNLVTAIASGLASATQTSTSLTLNGAATAITAKHGDAINVGVSVNPTTASGTVSLSNSKGGIDFSPLTSGVANWSSMLFPGGNYTVQAHYAGDGARSPSDSNAVSVSISPEASQSFVSLVTFDQSGNPLSNAATTAPYGSLYILRMDVADAAATLSAADGVSSTCSRLKASCPTGTLILKSDGVALDAGSFALNSKGSAEDFLVQLNGGTHTLTASYPGDSSYMANTGTSTVTITKAPTTVTARPSFVPGYIQAYAYGVPVSLRGTISTTSSGDGPTGRVTFTDNGADPGTDLRSYGVLPNPAHGSTDAFADYGDDYMPSTLGTHVLLGTYNGDTNYGTSSAPAISFEVAKAPPGFNYVDGTPNKTVASIPVSFTASLIGGELLAPTGPITFLDNGNPIPGTVTYTSTDGAWLSGGNYANSNVQAKLTATLTTLGAHTITASYPGDARYVAASSTQVVSVTVLDKIPPQMQGVGANYPTALRNSPVQLTTYVNNNTFGLPGPTGTVTFLDNGQPIPGDVTYAAGISLFAMLSYSFPNAGVHILTASYSGDSVYAAATSAPMSETILDKLGTTIPSVTLNPAVANQSTHISLIIRSAILGYGPPITGTVTVLDGGTPLAVTPQYTSTPDALSVNLDYTFPTKGTHNLTLQYSGDSNYQPTSSLQSLEVYGPLAVQLSQSQMAVSKSGGTVRVFFGVTNFTSTTVTANVTCQPDSTLATCSIDSPTIAVQPNATTSPTLTITVPSTTAANRRSAPWYTGGVFAAVFVGMCFMNRRRTSALLVLLLVCLSLSFVSCGGGGGSAGGRVNPPSNSNPTVYRFTVTATSGTNTDSRVLTLTLQ